uniref:Uncharacterized protein MANES_03G151700 n=1 Tax=Rhizophora mucronata TaxID=61149 RepID=A0A2P2MPI6_RHIMU
MQFVDGEVTTRLLLQSLGSYFISSGSPTAVTHPDSNSIFSSFLL